MRRTAVLAFVLLHFSLTGLAQKPDTIPQQSLSKVSYAKYMKQRNTFNTLGWVMLGAGLVMCSTSYLVYAADDFNGTWDLEPLFIAGLISTGSSIPLFIAASVNKRKARLALKGENISLSLPSLRQRYPAVALQIGL